jgi:ABC-2 type transport system permease protein
MFFRVLADEWVFLRTSGMWWAALATLSVITIVAAFVGSARVQQLDQLAGGLNADEVMLQQTLKAGVERYEANPSGDPPSTMNAGALGLSLLAHYAVKPSTPLAPLAVGQSDLAPAYYRVTAHAAYTFLNQIEIANALNLAAGSFDVAFVLIFVLPIFIVALTFDLLSKEKEQGTLALVLAHGVSVQTYVAAKVTARALLIGGLILIANLAAFVTIGADLTDGRTLLEAALWIIVSVVYGLFWFALALLINSWNWPSVTNGVVLANLWLVFVVVLPAFINIGATLIYPPPSRVELTTELRQASKEVEEEAAEAREQYYFDHPEYAEGGTPDAFYFQVLATESAISTAIAPHLAEFEEQARKQETMISRLQYLSPAILAQRALSGIAGTAQRWYDDFNAQVLAFHQVWQGFFSERILGSIPMSAASYDTIPVFGYRLPDSRFTVAQTAGPLAGLAAFFLLLTVLGIRSASRYPAV